ncbi:hypothetical protein KKJ01_08975 [Xenorhabdus bovienii]|uniref:Transposase n=1 Tax=Xenorhabdus bovienii TaxID=40576 RepID=A0AAJ1J782_XENBV|nr:hypothetical protein [Xenorhabdus bovienii]MDE1478364.1 hypothetical protein [Xenorhabdus bovienii]MDE9521632.1 hypothetical protein [Xenorhabdus bovienii]
MLCLKRVVARVFSDRSRETLGKLQQVLLSSFDTRFYCTGDYAAYRIHTA